MIQERLVSYNNKPTLHKDFESFYAKKLEDLVIALKAIIKGDVPYATGVEYACKVCSGRVKVHSQGHIYCLCCQTPHMWSKDLTLAVSRILESYPSYEGHKAQWSGKPDCDVSSLSKLSKQEMGHKIRKARVLLGMTQHDLAAKIFKDKQCQQHISQKAVTDYELGKSQPCQYIIEQLEQVLSIELRRGQ